ncbi:bifunctional adenosylcobinamide kinase/adenosylcobinamide-phosphate guanylyltransferase [Synechococcus sp. M16CYN]|uniref:bifunctional adenosylcobinamide kinase/adenosylcobinamide-phosphate guanylyltransferase n=1 Tax=Synechococcus sp. M16CYN TaxID=3103139 RepID=UPI003340E1AC
MSGPSRGGKSRWAESLLAEAPYVTYIATASDHPEDSNWQDRVRLHRERRPKHWHLVEPGLDLILALTVLTANQAVLIDSMGGFVASHLELDEIAWSSISNKLIKTLNTRSYSCVLVIEETGWGVVPTTKIGGLFRDRLGELTQKLDRIADISWLVLQGRAINLHSVSYPVP